MKASVLLTTAFSILAARPCAAQYAAPVIDELQPPSGQSVLAPELPDKQLLSLEAAVASSGAKIAQRKLAEVQTPVDEVRQIEKDYVLDPANKDLASELQARVRIYAARGADKPEAFRRFILLIAGPDARKRLPVPTIDCEAGLDKGVRVVAGRYLAAATDKGVLYSDLSRPTRAEAGCQSFEGVGTVRYGGVAAVQALKSVDVLPDALREAGLPADSAKAASGSADKILASKKLYEIYGNKDKLLATYPTQDGGELKLFWPAQTN